MTYRIQMKNKTLLAVLHVNAVKNLEIQEYCIAKRSVNLSE